MPAAGIVTGIGRVEGETCVVVANDATVKGGTYYPVTVKKHLRAQRIAAENRLPCIYLVDSGGAYLPLQDEVFPDREHFGRIFFNQARMSAAGIPQLSRRHGLVHGGRRLRAGDVGRDGHRPRPGHDLPRRPAAREGGDRRGGQRRGPRRRRRPRAPFRAWPTTSRPTTTTRCASCARSSATTAPGAPTVAPPDGDGEDPDEDPAGLLDVVPADLRTPYDVREVIRRIVDASRLHEFKARYGETLVCGFAHIHGRPVGILANNGILFSESALKGAHFIQLCESRRVPLLFLQNVAGFMVGREYEAAGSPRTAPRWSPPCRARRCRS